MSDAISPKKLGFVFIGGFADWEFGMLSASAVEYFGSEAIALTPKALPVKSIGGFSMLGARPLSDDSIDDLDALVVVGSDGWCDKSAPEIGPMLKAAAGRDLVVAGICAGTLPLAKAGLFAGRSHTSNGRDWIRRHLDYYPGDSQYRDVPHAVADGRIVSAPGSAPGTFAVAVLSALHPDRSDMLAGMRATFAGEYGGGISPADEALTAGARH